MGDEVITCTEYTLNGGTKELCGEPAAVATYCPYHLKKRKAYLMSEIMKLEQKTEKTRRELKQLEEK